MYLHELNQAIIDADQINTDNLELILDSIDSRTETIDSIDLEDRLNIDSMIETETDLEMDLERDSWI